MIARGEAFLVIPPDHHETVRVRIGTWRGHAPFRRAVGDRAARIAIRGTQSWWDGAFAC